IRRFYSKCQSLRKRLRELGIKIPPVSASDRFIGGMPDSMKTRLQNIVKIVESVGDVETDLQEVRQNNAEMLTETARRTGMTGVTAAPHELLTKLFTEQSGLASTCAIHLSKAQSAQKEIERFHAELSKLTKLLSELELKESKKKPVSWILETLVEQKKLQAAVQVELGTAKQGMNLVKDLGTVIMCKCAKQDVVLVRNLIQSCRTRLIKLTDRNRRFGDMLTAASKDAQTIRSQHERLAQWLKQKRDQLEKLVIRPDHVNEQQAQHREFQRELSAKDKEYRKLRLLINRVLPKCSPHDRDLLKRLIDDTKESWNQITKLSFKRYIPTI
ncbi:Microtubule-actin cross-linking factor 1, isoforms 1/2/3/5, partial [Cichlidogyrus casuarinus]